jgi:hypothetical protein
VEQLRRLGLASSSQRQRAQEVASLSKQLVETRDRLAGKEKLLKNRWLNLGKAVGAMRKVSLANRD